MRILLLLSLCLVTFVSCSKKKVEVGAVYTLEEFNHIMDSTGSGPDKAATAAIDFSQYAPGVNTVDSKPLVYERLGFAAIAFKTAEEARAEAVRLNQYYSRNWLFDKVEGEPILEDMVIVKFQAINPKRRIQRVPKNIPAEHHGAAGGEHGEAAPAEHH